MRRAPKRWNPRSAQAYRNNPTLNAQRAALRATDESVPQALSNYRPRVQRLVRFGLPALRIDLDQPAAASRRPTPTSARAAATSGWCRPLYNGQRTGNLTRQAEASVLAGRETLAQHRADHAARCRDLLHERAARHRDPRSAAAQRAGAAGAAQADARPLQCRRGDAHRRGAVGVAARRRRSRRCCPPKRI